MERQHMPEFIVVRLSVRTWTVAQLASKSLATQTQDETYGYRLGEMRYNREINARNYCAQMNRSADIDEME